MWTPASLPHLPQMQAYQAPASFHSLRNSVQAQAMSSTKEDAFRNQQTRLTVLWNTLLVWDLTADELDSRDCRKPCKTNGLTSPEPMAVAFHSALSTCSQSLACCQDTKTSFTVSKKLLHLLLLQCVALSLQRPHLFD